METTRKPPELNAKRADPPATDRSIRAINQELVRTYSEPLPINHLRQSELPSREVIIQVLTRIKDLLFPDHRLIRRVREGDTEYYIGGLMEIVQIDLCQQVLLARSYAGHDESPDDLAHRSHNDTMQFLKRLPQLRRTLAEDVQAAYEGDPAAASYDEIIFCYPGFEAVATHRIAHELHNLGVPLLPRIMGEHAHSLTGCDIHPGARIGNSFFIDHATGVVIGATAVIGDRVKLYQGVTLGALSFSHDAAGELIRTTKRHPTIEDDVVIYAGATILGGETVIGQGSVIGGSCWIIESIPPYTKVIMGKPQMKYHSSPGVTAIDLRVPGKESTRKTDWSI